MADWLPEQLQAAGIPGAAVAVVRGHDTLWEETYGHVDRSRSRAIDPETLFCVRSLSKSVTALAVLMAVQEGLVDLDEPIARYLPGFRVHTRFDPRPGDRMTLRHLLSSRAGLVTEPKYADRFDPPDYFEKHIRSLSDTWLRFPVGYRFSYSNAGVDLAGYILQQRSGVPFAEYIRRKVLAALGMTASSFDLEAVARRKNRAIGHYPSGEAAAVRFPEIPSAGLYSNLRDMVRYLRFHLNHGVVGGRRVLRPDLMQQLHEIAFPMPGQRTGYGLGLYREAVSNTFSLYHPGGGRGYQSLMILYPQLGFGVVLLTNRDGHDLTESPGKRVLNDAIRGRLGPNTVAEAGLEGLRRLEAGDARVQAVLGRYGGADSYAIEVRDGILGLSRGAGGFFPLTFFDDAGQLVGMYGETSELRFLPAYHQVRGPLMLSDRRFSNTNLHYQAFNDSPFDPPGPDKPEWRRYLGEYQILWLDEPFAEVSVGVRNGYLYYGERKCVEHLPGLFFSNDGQAIDFRSDPPTAANLRLRRLR